MRYNRLWYIKLVIPYSIKSAIINNVTKIKYNYKSVLPLKPVLSNPFVTSGSIKLNIDNPQPNVTYEYSTDGIIYNPLASNLTITGLSSNTEYNITVKAKNTAGESIVSNKLTQNTLPNAPKIITILSVTSNSIELNIDTPPLGVTYWYSTDGLTYNPLASNLTITGLSGNTEYNITVKAKNTAGESIVSNKLTQYTLPNTPLIDIFRYSPITIVIYLYNFSPYVKYIYSIDGYTYVPANIYYQSLSYIFNTITLKSNKEYSISVKAINGDRISEISNVLTQYTLPSAPTVTVGSVTSNSIKLNVDINKNPELLIGLTYVYSTDKKNYTSLDSDSTIRGLTSNTKYTITVKAINTAGGNVSNALTQYTLPDAPEISRNSVTSNSIKLNVNINKLPESLIGVTYIYSTDGEIYTSLISSTITGLSGNTEYNITVKATNTAGNSEASSVLNILTN